MRFLGDCLRFDEPLAGGDIGLRWMVAAPDAHPIGGSFSFTVTAAAPARTSVEEIEQLAQEPQTEAAAEEPQDATETTADEQQLPDEPQPTDEQQLPD